jgi:threonyl-tRNA synthetase
MEQEQLDHLRHSCAHLLAAAVMELWPGTKRTIGPAIENGFYYDFDFSALGGSASGGGEFRISEKDFPKIEAKMLELAKSWKGFERKEVSKEEAFKLFQDNEYKKELIEEFAKEGQKLTLFTSGTYTDLCRGGHCPHPNNDLKYFDLLSVAGAYWRGSEKNKMLTRIYGTCFPTRTGLDDYLKGIEEAKKRDHRKIGKELDLFTFSDLVGKGLPLYTQRGALVRRLLHEYVEDIQVQEGYMQVWTPQIARAELFKISGHYDKYKENLFQVKSNYSEEEMFLKPMNCPNATQIYASKSRSYRDLPIRMTDFAMLYRDEKPGELNGLARTRSFSQDDCHVFCREDQVDHEVDTMLAMTKKIMRRFGFTYRYRLSTSDKAHPEKYLGEPRVWAKVEAWAEKIMKRNAIEYYDGPGEAAFYAPKMDLMATDALGREWQLSTVQIDYFLPERFHLTYTGEDGKEKQPIMLHRAIIGSAERMMMILLEHYAGAFPVWLAPVQVTLIPIAERHVEMAQKMASELRGKGIRVEIDEKSEPMGAKIRAATLQKVPFMGIIGDKEVTDGCISVRTRKGEDLKAMNVENFLSLLQEAIEHTV